MQFLASIITASSATLAIAASSSSYSSGPAAMFLVLSDYPPAQKFCLQNYPPAAPTTVTRCSATPSYTGSTKRRGENGSSTVLSQALFQALMRQDESTLKAFCSDIASPVHPTTVIVNCAAGQSCGSDGICRPTRDCSNPVSCDGNSFCGQGPAGNDLFCHQDTDNDEMGYCMNDGPSDSGCPEPYQDCDSNADCGGSRVCIYSCCRTEPFCVDVSDYQSAT